MCGCSPPRLARLRKLFRKFPALHAKGGLSSHTCCRAAATQKHSELAHPARAFMAASALEAWVPENAEAIYFDSLLALADAGGSGELAGAAAVSFFSKSALDRAILKSVSRTFVDWLCTVLAQLRLRRRIARTFTTTHNPPTPTDLGIGKPQGGRLPFPARIPHRHAARRDGAGRASCDTRPVRAITPVPSPSAAFFADGSVEHLARRPSKVRFRVRIDEQGRRLLRRGTLGRGALLQVRPRQADAQTQ